MKRTRLKLTTPGLPKIVISGSFRKHLQEINDLMQRFNQSSVYIQAPKTSVPVHAGEEFIILETDPPGKSAVELEKSYLQEIRQATFLYVADVDGYIGQSAGTEMAYARLNRIPIVAAETIAFFSKKIPAAAQEILLQSVLTLLPKDEISKERIQEIQSWINRGTLSELTLNQQQELSSLVRHLINDLRSIQV